MKKNFAWKRKASNIKQSKSHSLVAFSEEEQLTETVNNATDSLLTDNVVINKRSKRISNKYTVNELKEKASKNAEAGRYADAIVNWDEALLMRPDDATIHEMKSQVLLEMDEVFLAVKSAEKATSCDRLWSVGYQTLGRAQLAIHDYKMAIRSFSVSLHLNPVCEELWTHDLPFSTECYKQQKADIQNYQQQLEEDRAKKKPTIVQHNQLKIPR